MIRQCIYCKKEFKPTAPNNKFCSEECKKLNLHQIRHQRYLNPLPKITNCLQCGKPLEGHYKKFCSEHCIIEHRKESRRKTNRICNPVIEPKELRKCIYCGNDIPFNKNYASTYNKRKFCSKSCCAQYFKLNKDNFNGNQFNYGEFKIIIKNILGKFMWEAIKNNKTVLKSDHSFNTFQECKKDVRNAF